MTLLNNVKNKWKIFFQILWHSQNIGTLHESECNAFGFNF